MSKERLIAFLLLIVGGIFIFNLTGSIWRLWHKDKPLKEAEIRLERLKEENAELKRKKAYINSERFFEEQTRDKLNMAKENEAIVILPEEIFDLKDELEEEKDKGEKDNWKKWVEVFL